MAEDASLIGLRSFMARYAGQSGRTLVVGSKVYDDKPDRRRLYADAFGVDLFEGEGVDLEHDLEKPLPEGLGKFNHVDCVSVMEHVQRPWLMAANIEAVMAPGASILFCAPFCWRVHGYPSDYFRFTVEALPILFPNITWQKRGYLVGDRLRRVVPGMNNEAGKWMARAEAVGVGVRCV